MSRSLNYLQLKMIYENSISDLHFQKKFTYFVFTLHARGSEGEELSFPIPGYVKPTKKKVGDSTFNLIYMLILVTTYILLG